MATRRPVRIGNGFPFRILLLSVGGRAAKAARFVISVSRFVREGK